VLRAQQSGMPKPTQTERVLWIIMAAVLAWGIFHAVGAYLYNHYWGRPAVVLLCVATFLGWWAWLLRRRAAAEARSQKPEVRS
jgi:uncharacterized iron-regulated membrane protein